MKFDSTRDMIMTGGNEDVSMQGNGVNTAFEMLLEEIEVVRNNLNKEGSRVFDAGNYEVVDCINEKAKRLAEYHRKIRALHEEWVFLQKELQKECTSNPVRRPQRARKARRVQERSPRGHGIKMDDLKIPILEVLVELGGKATSGEVQDRLKNKIKLTEYDLEKLPSRSARWRTMTRWCVARLKKSGMLKADSPKGIWEITELGRKYLLKSRTRKAQNLDEEPNHDDQKQIIREELLEELKTNSPNGIWEISESKRRMLQHENPEPRTE